MMITQELVGVGVVGVGRAGLVHAQNFAYHVPNARLVSVMDTNSQRVQEVASSLAVDYATDLDRFLQDPRIDAVCVTLPTFLHASVVEQVARAGKHILCEKPLALTPDEAFSMATAVKTSDIKFVMGFMRRFDKAFQRARQMITEGAIGEPIVIKSTGRGPGLPPAWAWDINLSNGMLGEVNSHDFDTVRWFSGSEFSNAYARGKNFRSPDVGKLHPNFYDNALVLVEMESGAIGTVDGSCPADYGYDARIEVLGTEGVLFVGTTAEDSVTVWTRPNGVRQSGVTSWRSLFREAYLAEDCHLVDCILNNTQPLVGLEDGLRALEVVRAANLSIQSRQVSEIVRKELPQ